MITSKCKIGISLSTKVKSKILDKTVTNGVNLIVFQYDGIKL